MAELSRAAKVNRTLIYYYFGDSKEAIVNSSVTEVGQFFFGKDSDRLPRIAQSNSYELICELREHLNKAPYIADFYLHWRRIPSVIQKEFIRLEANYFKRMKTAFPNLADEALSAIFAMTFGLVISPTINKESIKVASDFIRETFIL
jgi:AcrR family transcriptional regulator